MKQIDLFYIPHPEVAKQDRKKLNKLNELMAKGKTQHVPTKWHHLFMMSKYFNLYILPDNEDKISDVDYPVIYHIPDGTRSVIHPSVKSTLYRYKDDIPIVMRSYDPHPPRKLSKEFMTNWHDLSITYIKDHTNQENILFGKWGYDNHLFGTFDLEKERNRLACMIHSNRTENKHNKTTEEYSSHGVSLKKTHDFRREIAKHPSLDVFGSGWSVDLPGYKGKPQPFDQKYTTLKKYKFNIVVLPAIAEDYIDEKILDSFLTLTVPVVLGPSTLTDHLPSDSFININEFLDIGSLFNHLENMTEKKYMNHLQSIQSNREDIFEDFSTKENYANLIYNWYCDNHERVEDIGYDPSKIDGEITDLELQRSSDSLAELRRISQITYDRLTNYFNR